MTKNLDRYHRTIFFPETFEKDIGVLLKGLNKKHWVWGFHAVKKLLESINKDIARKIVSFVYHLEISGEDVFEVYYFGKDIEKFCIRLPLDDEFDLILVITKDKAIVTLYVNFKDNIHIGLDESLYKTGE